MQRTGALRAAALTLGLGLLISTSSGCAKKSLEVLYSHHGTCKTWSDSSDDPALAFIDPLIVFRVTKITNTSTSGTPATRFRLGRVYVTGSAIPKHYPDFTISAPPFGDFAPALQPGETVTYPDSTITGLAAVQMFGEGYSTDEDSVVAEIEFYLNYETGELPNTDPLENVDSVVMIKAVSSGGFRQFCGMSVLNGM